MSDFPTGNNLGKIKATSRRNQAKKPYSRPKRNKSLFSRVTDSFKTLLTPIAPTWLTQKTEEEPTSSSNSTPAGTSKSPSWDYWKTPELPSSSNQIGNQPSGNTNNRNHDIIDVNDTPTTSTTSMHKIKPNSNPKPLGKQALLSHLAKFSDKTESPPTNSLPGHSSSQETTPVSSTSTTSEIAKPVQQKWDLDDPECVKRLWSMSPLVARQQATRSSSKRPKFNSTLFGAPAAANISNSTKASSLPGSSRSKENIMESSFYNGPTRFGGANSQSYRNLYSNSKSPYRFPKTTKVRVRQLDQSNGSIGGSSTSSQQSDQSQPSMSSTAKKIFDVLDRMSTPLNDVKKIPAASHRVPSSFMVERQKRRRSLISQNADAPPTKGMNTALSPVKIRRTHATIPINRQSVLLRNVAKEHNKKSTTTEIKRITPPIPTSGNLGITSPSLRGVSAIEASLSSSSNYTAAPKFHDMNKSSSGKMKSARKSTGHYSFNAEPDEEKEEPLPSSDFTLPVNKSMLPTFSFVPAAQSTPAPIDTRSKEKKTKTGTDVSFNFAKPSVISKPLPAQSTIAKASEPVYEFSTPDVSILDEGVTKEQSGGSPSSKPKQNLLPGSVMDILKKGKPAEKKEPLNLLDKYKQDMKEKWTCDVCMVHNNQDVTKCAACTTPKPNDSGQKEATKSKSPATPASNWGNKFKTPEGNWTCDVCMISNKKDSDKCVACETPKPGAKVEEKKLSLFGNLKTNSNSGSGFTFGAPASKEKSSTGSVKFGVATPQSKSSESATTTIKFGASSANDATSKSSSGIKFGAKSTSQNSSSNDIKFGFGTPADKSSIATKEDGGFGEKFKPKSGSWECEVCMIVNGPQLEKCVACESPKPGATSNANTSFKSSFKFGNTSSSLFKFGNPVSAQVETMQAKENEKPKKLEINKVEKPATEVKKPVVISQSASSQPAKPTFSFGQQKQADTAEQKTTKTAKTTESKEMFSFGAPKQTSLSTAPATSSAATPPPTFNFGATSAKSTEGTASLASSTAVVSAASSTQSSTGSGGFSFSQTSSTKAAPLFGNDKPKSVLPNLPNDKPAPSFNFGTPSKPAETGSFKSEVDNTKDATPMFGNQTTVTSTTTSQSGALFKFGQTTSSTSSSAATQNTDAKPGFTFGQSTTQSTTNSIFARPAATSEPAKPAFGITAQTTSATAFGTGSQPPAFGAGTVTTSSTPSIFGSGTAKTTTRAFGTDSVSKSMFGNTAAAPAFGASNPPPAFGSPSSKPPPAFGSSDSKPAGAAPAFGGFGNSGGAFGSPSTNNTPAPAFGSPTSKPPPAFGSPTAKPPPAFGSPSSQPASTASPFQFGANTQQQSSSPAGGGIFGNATTQAASSNSNASSAFGSIPKPSFNFGSSTTTEQNPAAAPAFGGFNFSANKPAQNQTAAPAFGASNPASSSTPSAGFNFGNASNNTGNSTGGSSVFQFGGSKPAEKPAQSSVFAFGSNKPAENNASANAFGSSSSAFSSSNQISSSTGFNFGSSAAAPSTGYNFGSGGTSNAAPAFGAGSSGGNFSIGSGGSGVTKGSPFGGSTRRATTPTGGRQIKRATRKLRK